EVLVEPGLAEVGVDEELYVFGAGSRRAREGERRCGNIVQQCGVPGRGPPDQHAGLLDNADVERDARAVRGRDGALEDVATLRRARLGAEDLIERGGHVLLKLLLRERRLADHEVHVRVLVDTELDAATLDV